MSRGSMASQFGLARENQLLHFAYDVEFGAQAQVFRLEAFVERSDGFILLLGV